jgi:hypothetical protein
MLLEFSVENFKCFKERVTLSMEATSDKAHPDNVAEMNKETILKTATMYGSNASGKTNFIEAMWLMQRFVLSSHTHVSTLKLGQTPFAFDKRSKSKPTHLGVKFIKDGIKYDYSFSYTENGVVSESLTFYPNGRVTTVFERSGSDYKFVKDKGRQKMDSERVIDKALYLSVSAQFNYHITKTVFDWFLTGFLVITGNETQLLKILIEKTNKEPKFKARVMKALNIADLGITSIKDKVKKRDPTSVLPTQIGPELDIWVGHTVKNNGKETIVELPILAESSGTIRFMSMIGPIIDGLGHGKTIVIDEIDANFHSDLCEWIVGLFHDNSENPKNAQLIFNTHDTSLMDLDKLRRDQIWFVEKDWETGISDVISLSEYKVRNDADIGKAYKAGRYGAKPFISTERLME